MVEFIAICKDEQIALSEEKIIMSGYKLDKGKDGTVDFNDFEQFWDAPDHAAFLEMSDDDDKVLKALRKYFESWADSETTDGRFAAQAGNNNRRLRYCLCTWLLTCPYRCQHANLTACPCACAHTCPYTCP